MRELQDCALGMLLLDNAKDSMKKFKVTNKKGQRGIDIDLSSGDRIGSSEKIVAIWDQEGVGAILASGDATGTDKEQRIKAIEELSELLYQLSKVEDQLLKWLTKDYPNVFKELPHTGISARY